MIPTDFPDNLGKILDAGPAPEATAVIDLSGSSPARWTYGALDALCDSIAAGLLDAGVRRGDRVGLMAANSVAALAVLLGAMRAGAVAVPVNPRAGGETLAYMCSDAAMRLVFADEGFLDRVPVGLRVVTLGSAEFGAFTRPRTFETVTPEPGETAMILYTSGSTGTPKGVMLSHESQVLIARGYVTPAMDAAYAAGPAIVAAPLFHMNATAFSSITFLMRGAMVLMPRFEARAFIDAISRHRVSALSGVPTMAALIAQEHEALAAADLSSVKAVTIGSAPLSDSVLAQVQKLFPGAGVVNSYGTTETGAGYLGPHPEGKPRPPMSVGYPQAHARLRLVGERAPNEGVLEVHCATRMSGYLNRPELTAAKLRDGWIDTGDIMRRDADGWFYFVGRADDMFVCSGENVYPGAVERVLERHPDVLEVCVLPLSDPVRGDVPVAFVVPRTGSAITEQQLKDHVIAHAAPFMHPRKVWFIDRMPLAGTNKIDRHALKSEAIRRRSA